MIYKIFTAAFVVLLAGCAVNGYEKYYTPTSVQIASLPYALSVPKTPKVYAHSEDVRGDSKRLAENGYVLLGSSSFWGPERIGTKSQAIAEAERVGATIVMIKSTYKDTVTGTVPFTVPNAPQVATVNTTGTVNTYNGGYANYNSSSTVTMPGGSTTYNMPFAVSRSDFVATYWAARDTSKIRLGINSVPLPDDVRNRLQRNTGLLVAIVVVGTPAFRANILEGDILLKLNGEDLLDTKDLTDKVNRFAGQSVEFTIIRGSEPRTIQLTLGS
jgi:hypothetical protein